MELKIYLATKALSIPRNAPLTTINANHITKLITTGDRKETQMDKISALFLILTLTVLSGCSTNLRQENSELPHSTDNAARLKELNEYWAEVSRCVKEGDFEGYKATCHKDGVLVSGKTNEAYPLSKALPRWKQDFTDAESGKIKAAVEFRFDNRFGDKTTAHETGMFFYSRTNADGTKKSYYIHLEALLIKRGTWKMMMEYQKSEGTEEEWNKLKQAI